MAHHPCSRAPSVPGLVDPEEVDVPVEMRPVVPRRYPREAPQVALGPGAQVVHHLHPLQVDRVVHIGPVRLDLEPAVPDQRVVRPLEVADERRPGRYPAAHGLPHARRAGLPVAAGDRDRFPVDVYRHTDAQLLAGQAALALLPVALGEVGVADVGLVHPYGVSQHDPVPVAGHRGEHAVAPPGAALRAFRVRPIGRCGLGERDDTDLVAAEPLVDGEARHERPEGSLFPCESVPSARTPTRRDCRQTKIRAGARVSFPFGWEEHGIRGFPVPESSPVI